MPESSNRPSKSSDVIAVEEPDEKYEYIFFHDWSSDEDLVLTLTDAIEGTPGVSIPEASLLGRHIDIEAIEDLFENSTREESNQPMELTFPYEGCLLSIKDNGLIRVILQERETDV